MDATQQQLDDLRLLQEVDRKRLQADLALTKLPQPEQAEEIRSKLSDVVKKISQVKAMLDEQNAELVRRRTEDEMLISKIGSIQESIEQSSGDYRSVTALTRDMEGAQKRRETLSFEMGKISNRINEVSAVFETACRARDSLVEQEKQLAEDYRAKGRALKALSAEALTVRDSIVERLPENILKEYERVLSKCKGVAIATVDGSRCSVCRNTIDPSRLLQMQSEAPLSHCPNCGRIAIMEGGNS